MGIKSGLKENIVEPLEHVVTGVGGGSLGVLKTLPTPIVETMKATVNEIRDVLGETVNWGRRSWHELTTQEGLVDKLTHSTIGSTLLYVRRLIGKTLQNIKSVANKAILDPVDNFAAELLRIPGGFMAVDIKGLEDFTPSQAQILPSEVGGFSADMPATAAA